MPAIRPASAADFDAYVRLLRDLNLDQGPSDPQRLRVAWEALMAAPQTVVLLAEVDGVPASSCTLTLVPNLTRNARPYGLIENVVTLAEFRQRGLGAAVLSAALDRAWDADC